MALKTPQWILISTVLAASMAFLDGSAMSVALPALQRSLNATASQFLWVVNGYTLMLASLILTGGALGDRLGRKRLYMIGTTVFMLASLACGLAPTIHWLIGARVLQGIGGALLVPGSLAILSATFNEEERGQVIGAWSAATTIVLVAGPALWGYFTEIGWWRVVFLINLPLGIMALLILRSKVSESREQISSAPIDFAGTVLATLALAGLAYGFIAAPELGFRHPRVYGSLTVGLAALVAFGVVEGYKEYPMLPLRFFRSRTFSGVILLTFCLYGALNVVPLFLSLNLVQAQGYSRLEAGFALCPHLCCSHYLRDGPEGKLTSAVRDFCLSLVRHCLVWGFSCWLLQA